MHLSAWIPRHPRRRARDSTVEAPPVRVVPFQRFVIRYMLDWCGAACTEGARLLRRCDACGYNKYYGKPCPHLDPRD